MNNDATMLEQELQQDETLHIDDFQGNQPAEHSVTVEQKEDVAVENTENETIVDNSLGESEVTPTIDETLEISDVTMDVPYHERYYLKYREGKRSVSMDLAGTKALLKEMGFDGGELRQARKGKDCAKSFSEQNKSKNNQMVCSYCGAEISGIEFYRLPDGRVRCTACSSTTVKTKAEMEEICRCVITNMDSFFGATLDVSVSVEVLDELKLKKRLGIPLGSNDRESMLVLGVAVNKKNKYKILLENGAPRISLIATFAHELTHIWQYTHWDNQKTFNKCPENKKILIYEGMAKWVEIQYLYLVGEYNVAKREEYITRNRQDEYGIGFRLYESKYPLSREAMKCDDTPFTPNNYPLD